MIGRPMDRTIHWNDPNCLKFLTICEGGNCRSVAMAMQIKQHGKQDAIACGWRWTSVETLETLIKWADVLVVMEGYFLDKLKEKGVVIPDEKKVLVVDVGPDRYGHPMNMELNVPLNRLVLEWKAKNWQF
jgi:predicted protein tyrosine phosphatase